MSDPRVSHVAVERVTPQYWRVTFDHGPINTITADTVAELSRVVDEIERDEELTVAVFDRVARRLASFDKQAIAENKALVDAASLPDDAELPPALTAFFASAGRPAAQARVAALAAHGYGQDGELERRLGELVTLASTSPGAAGEWVLS